MAEVLRGPASAHCESEAGVAPFLMVAVPENLRITFKRLSTELVATEPRRGAIR
ncbi:hypothetical protein BJ964_002061 [Actinoplanes lobatus]|uniref:Uncharacterized protein n=1 Tax=Actinoplanes lobatus TaxID=113568 RepID=A0A7W7MFG5_9ACTN|nr:hypothetical protein [Actinoplanes lobatus]